MKKKQKRKPSTKIYTKTGYIAYHTKAMHELIKKGNLSLARKVGNSLLMQYPDDEVLMLTVSKLLVLEKRHEEAKAILEDLPDECTFRGMTSLSIKLDEKERLEHLYQLYYKDEQVYDEKITAVYQLFQSYLRAEYDETYAFDYPGATYLDRQVTSYSKENALEHIIQRHGSAERADQSYFYSDINIEKLFMETSDYITRHKDKASLRNEVADSYLFYQPSCGVDKKIDSPVNYFKVITLINSPNIITMFPSKHIKHMDICSLNEDRMSKAKVKVRSGLERFNDRYGVKK